MRPDRQRRRRVERRVRQLGRLEQWTVDLSAYAGGSVEVSIAYISDWATQGLGVFVDDIEVSTGEGSTSFEAGDTGGWEITGPPPGSAPNPNDFIITTAAGFPEAAVAATPHSLLTGFGSRASRMPRPARSGWAARCSTCSTEPSEVVPRATDGRGAVGRSRSPAATQWNTERASAVTSMGTVTGRNSDEIRRVPDGASVTVALRPSPESARTSSRPCRECAASPR